MILVGTPEMLPLVRGASATTVSIVRSGDEQLARLRALDLDLESCYLWAGGEHGDVSAVRAFARREWKLAKDRQHTQHYWVRDKPSSRG